MFIAGLIICGSVLLLEKYWQHCEFWTTCSDYKKQLLYHIQLALFSCCVISPSSWFPPALKDVLGDFTSSGNCSCFLIILHVVLFFLLITWLFLYTFSKYSILEHGYNVTMCCSEHIRKWHTKELQKLQEKIVKIAIYQLLRVCSMINIYIVSVYCVYTGWTLAQLVHIATNHK